MRSTQELLDEAVGLPVDERARLVDALLRSLNPVPGDLDRLWGEEAARRLADAREGRAEPIPADEVFVRARLRTTRR